jgi:hypothetical protein
MVEKGKLVSGIQLRNHTIRLEFKFERNFWKSGILVFKVTLTASDAVSDRRYTQKKLRIVVTLIYYTFTVTYTLNNLKSTAVLKTLCCLVSFRTSFHLRRVIFFLIWWVCTVLQQYVVLLITEMLSPKCIRILLSKLAQMQKSVFVT